MPGTRPNIVLFGVDLLLADHMSCYGYPRLTTPYIDRFAAGGTLYERNYSPHIPTTSAYSSMLTGTDCFTNQVVALRHQGPLRAEVKTLPEFLKNRATPPPASGSAAIQPPVASISTWTTRAGVAGTRAAVRRPRT